MAKIVTFPVRRKMLAGARQEEVLFTIEIDIEKLPQHLFDKAAKNKKGETSLAYGAIRLIYSDL